MAGKEVIFLHESPNNVIFRCQYLRYWFANLQGKLAGYYWIMEKTIRIAKDYVNSDDNSFLVDDELDNGCEIDNNFSLENDVEFD